MIRRVLVLLVGAAACQPATTRPAFLPRPEALGAELRLSVSDATRRLAESLRTDSIPVRTVRLRDGYIETPWFASRTGRPVKGQQPLGRGTVRVRAWADPARPGSTQLTVETLYRPVADPSLPERELERQVPADHPAAKKVQAAVERLVQRYGTPPPRPAAEPETGAEEEREY
jgi:hypothetical protein